MHLPCLLKASHSACLLPKEYTGPLAGDKKNCLPPVMKMLVNCLKMLCCGYVHHLHASFILHGGTPAEVFPHRYTQAARLMNAVLEKCWSGGKSSKPSAHYDPTQQSKEDSFSKRLERRMTYYENKIGSLEGKRRPKTSLEDVARHTGASGTYLSALEGEFMRFRRWKYPGFCAGSLWELSGPGWPASLL